MPRRRRRQKSSSLFFPLLFLLILVGCAYAVWNMFYTPEGIPQKTEIISMGKESPKIRLEESANFSKIYGVDELWEKESIHSEEGGDMLTFFEKSSIALDRDTVVTLNKVRNNERDESHNIVVSLDSGRMWANVASSVNPKSQFAIYTKNFSVFTKGGSFSIDPYGVVTTKGRATVRVGENYTKDVEVGQQISFSEEDLLSINNGKSGPEKELLSDVFRMSNWFLANTKEEEEKINDIEVITEEEAPFIVPEKTDEENPLQITAPGKNGSTITTNESPVRIKGTVPAGTTKVMVNGYTLSQFVTGNTEFLYVANADWQTLKEGENVYTIIALGADEERYEAKITVLYKTGTDEVVTEEEGEGETEEDTPEEEVATEEEEPETITGELSISSPKDDDTLTKAETVVSGTAPSNAASIVVNGYTLSKFTKGDTSWTYIISEKLGNRPVGEFTIKVEAKDKDGKVLDTKSATVTIQKLPQNEPTGGDELEMREGTLPPVEGLNNEPTI